MRALGTMSTPGSSDLVSPTVAPYSPSTDYISDDLKSAKIMPWLRPELCNSRALQVAPRQYAPSYWRARPSPAYAVCEPTLFEPRALWCAAFVRLLHDCTTSDDEEAPERALAHFGGCAKLLLATCGSLQGRET